ncbi:hypothetical protein NDU88_010000 [Pleurodeles waltl]|uniref:Uncharacterized protein n=1 Tax=Pleurodeles waltl TaxID=8319 RepID=A0AAV7QWZ5_PLEWA|nr:hypothetical protein NDU88_010000 [Pleurodeles waltl]
MRCLPAGPAPLRRVSGIRGPLRETPSNGRERPARSEAGRNTHPEPIAGVIKRRRGGAGEPRPESTAGQASTESSAPLSPRLSIRGSGRRLRSPRAHLRSQRAWRAAGARPLDAPPPPGPGQQSDPAQTSPASLPGGSARSPLHFCPD